MSITVKDLEMRFTDASGDVRTVLDIPALEVEDGTQLCLRGSSGCGKTTLLNILAGITMPTSGSVSHGDTEITGLSEAERDRFRADNVGYVFQTFNLLQGLSALENVMVAAGFAGHASGASARGKELLERMGLSHRAHAKPGRLSVGEQQRVAIARAVVNQPKVVLADEPTANLDDTNGDEVLELLKDVTSEQGSILVLVTHESRVQDRFDDVKLISEVSR